MRPGHCSEAGAPGGCSDCEGTWGLQRERGCCRRRLVVAAASCPASARLGSDISVATFRWRHFGGNISVAPFGRGRCHRVFVVASSSPHRRRRIVVAAPRRCASSSSPLPLSSPILLGHVKRSRGWGAEATVKGTWGLQGLGVCSELGPAATVRDTWGCSDCEGHHGGCSDCGPAATVSGA